MTPFLIMGAPFLYLGIGLAFVWVFDDNPNGASLIPLLFWPAIIVGAVLIMMLKPIKDKIR